MALRRSKVSITGWLLCAGIATAAQPLSASTDEIAGISSADVVTVPTQAQWMGAIESKHLNESSGLAASQKSSDVLWSINDSGGKAQLFALTITGKHLGTWMLDLPTPVDWEALSSFIWRGSSYLLIADIGDNFAMRESVSYHVVAEPNISAVSRDEPLVPVLTHQFSYPRGPRDSEAIAVDSARGEILVLSKRTEPPELYRLPLQMPSDAKAAPQQPVASYLTTLRGFSKPPRSAVDLYGDAWGFLPMPTGMSLAGDRLLVTTLEHAYVFDRRNLSAAPRMLPMPYAGQREGITFALDCDDTAYLSHERKFGLRNADIYRLRFKLRESTENTGPREPRAGSACAE